MPFVHNCICNCMKCKPAKNACVDGGAKQRGGGARTEKILNSLLNVLISYHCIVSAVSCASMMQ